MEKWLSSFAKPCGYPRFISYGLGGVDKDGVIHVVIPTLIYHLSTGLSTIKKHCCPVKLLGFQPVLLRQPNVPEFFLRQPIQPIQLLTTLVTPQRGDNIDNSLLGHRPNDRCKSCKSCMGCLKLNDADGLRLSRKRTIYMLKMGLKVSNRSVGRKYANFRGFC